MTFITNALIKAFSNQEQSLGSLLLVVFRAVFNLKTIFNKEIQFLLQFFKKN